jgi:tRNA uridine 5-carboxymethylaminomethyl modification enzyme
MYARRVCVNSFFSCDANARAWAKFIFLSMLQSSSATPATRYDEEFDVIVVGGGHAGCEAALAAARLGAKTMLLTLSLDRIAWQPCNPAVGGPAKSQLVHEVDALGGWIGKMADRCYLQKRVLNLSKVSPHL